MSTTEVENNKFIIGLYDHEEKLLKAIKHVRSKGIEIHDALTPFAVHGIDPVLGLKDTRIHTAGFFFGLTGTTTALSIITFISKFNYPTIIGGKPFWALPAYIPVIFELTVLFASVGMVTTYLIRNKLWPGRIPRIFDKRTTDHLFALTFAIDHKSASDIDSLKSVLGETGAMEINMKEFHDSDEPFN